MTVYDLGVRPDAGRVGATASPEPRETLDLKQMLCRAEHTASKLEAKGDSESASEGDKIGTWKVDERGVLCEMCVGLYGRELIDRAMNWH